MSVRVTVDEAALRDVEQRLGQFADKAPNAIVSALNRSVTNMSSNITKEVRQGYHIKASDVKATLKAFKASRSKLEAQVKSSGKMIGTDKFKVSPKTVNPKRKSQLKIAVKKDGVKQVLGAFIVDLHGTKVFKRTGEKVYPTKGRYKGKGIRREKIERNFGPSVPQMIGNDEVVQKINHKAFVTYETRLNHEINRILARVGAN
ncbi:MAG: phage tail protein [Solibacillus sp.]